MKFLSNYWYQAKCLIFPFIRLTWSMNDKSNVCFGKKKLNHFGWMFRFYSLLVLLLPAISTSSQISITFLGVMCSMSVGSPSIVKYFMNIAIVSVSPNAVASIHFGPNSARLILPSAVSQRRNTIVNCSQKLLWESPKLFHLLHNLTSLLLWGTVPTSFSIKIQAVNHNQWVSEFCYFIFFVSIYFAIEFNCYSPSADVIHIKNRLHMEVNGLKCCNSRYMNNIGHKVWTLQVTVFLLASHLYEKDLLPL